MEKKLNLRLMCRGISIDERTHDYIEKRISKISKFINSENETIYEIEISNDKKGKFRAEIMINTPYKLYRIEETTESIEGSVDMAVDELKNQISRDRDKMRELKERGARSLKKKMVLDEDSRF
jgi:putative sigma-54 modulation protein